MTWRWPPLGFSTRNDGFKYSTVLVLRAHQICAGDPAAGCKHTVGDGPCTGWFHWPHVHLRLERASCTVVTTDIWVKHVVVLVQERGELGFDICRRSIFMVETHIGGVFIAALGWKTWLGACLTVLCCRWRFPGENRDYLVEVFVSFKELWFG